LSRVLARSGIVVRAGVSFTGLLTAWAQGRSARGHSLAVPRHCCGFGWHSGRSKPCGVWEEDSRRWVGQDTSAAVSRTPIGRLVSMGEVTDAVLFLLDDGGVNGCQPCRGWWLASALGRPARRRVTSCACRARIGDRSSFGLRNCETALLQASRGWGRPRSEVAQRKQCLSRVAVAASGENQPEARLIMRAAMATTCATTRASRDPVELKRATILLGQPARRELEVSIKPGT